MTSYPDGTGTGEPTGVNRYDIYERRGSSERRPALAPPPR